MSFRHFSSEKCVATRIAPINPRNIEATTKERLWIRKKLITICRSMYDGQGVTASLLPRRGRRIQSQQHSCLLRKSLVQWREGPFQVEKSGFNSTSVWANIAHFPADAMISGQGYPHSLIALTGIPCRFATLSRGLCLLWKERPAKG